MNPRIILGDTETSGLSATAKAVEIAWFEIDPHHNILDKVHSRLDPMVPIEPGASGVHGITNKMVEDSPSEEQFFKLFVPGGAILGPSILVAHNAPFDVRFYGPWMPELIGTICTLRCSRILYPEAQNHKMQTLRFMLDLEAGDAHSALGDVVTLYSLIERIKQDFGLSVLDLIDLQKKAVPIEKMTFGKHRGVPLKDVPRDYFQWLMKQEKVDPDLMVAMKNILEME